MLPEFGGVNARYPPRFPFCAVDEVFPALRPSGLPVSRVPAFGFMALPVFVPRAENSPRDPDEIAET